MSDGYQTEEELLRTMSAGRLDSERLSATDSHVLLQALSDTDGPQTVGLVFELRRRWEPEVVPALVSLLSSDSADVRSAVADVLGQMADMRSASAVLDRLLIETDDPTREMLIYALSALPTPSAVDVLLSFVGSEVWKLDRAARRSLERLKYVYPDRAPEIELSLGRPS
jgi:hypothetical protein